MAFSPVVLLQKILGLETTSLGSLKLQHRETEDKKLWWHHFWSNFEVESGSGTSNYFFSE